MDLGSTGTGYTSLRFASPFTLTGSDLAPWQGSASGIPLFNLWHANSSSQSGLNQTHQLI